MDTRKGIAVLGSTGSIGVNTLSVVASHPDRFAVLALAAHSNIDKLEEQVRRFRPRLAVLFDAERAARICVSVWGIWISKWIRAWTDCAAPPSIPTLAW